MKYLAGVLAIATLSLAAPEADPAYALYAPWGYPYAAPYYRPYFASGYAGPLPGNSYQAVTRLHKREADAEADPQLLLNAAPFALPAAPLALPAAPAFSLAPAPAVFNTPLVKSVVETPATVAHAVHASPLLAYAPYGVAPVVAPAVHTGPLVLPSAGVPVALGPHDCVTEGGCALRAALATGLPASTVGATTVYGRKRREAEAEAEATADPAADADADADPYLLYGNYYGHPYAYGAYPYAAHYPYYNYAPYAAYAPYYASYAPYYAAALAAPVAPVVHPVAAPAVVETVSKPVTYTHLGAHPIAPTTVIQTEHRLVGK